MGLRGLRAHFVSQGVRFFWICVEICRSGELPVLFEDGEGGPEANGWRSFSVGEDLLDVGEGEAGEHRDLGAELFSNWAWAVSTDLKKRGFLAQL